MRIPKIYFSFQITAIFLNVFIGITSKIIKPSIAIRIDNDIAKIIFFVIIRTTNITITDITVLNA